jgi:LmbE family N-acetylglucosaminyl deacetylase
MAKYAAEGVRTVLVTATLGEEGEIRDPDLDPEEAKGRLGEIRQEELRRSAEVIGISQVHVLGFRDSGMAGTPANDHPDNFHNADGDEAVARVVRLIRQERPQVLVTDNERGTYGHPDHMAANRTTLAAFDAAGDANRFPDAGSSPWQPQKLYYTAFARSDFLRMVEWSREHGFSWGEEEESEDAFDFTVPDDVITTRIEVLPYRSRTRDAMRVHRTQIAPDDPWLNLPEEMTRELMQTDSYVRIRSLVDAPLPENDLFTGLRQVNPELS